MSRDIYELIEKMIDKKVKGADTYINNGSRWLIFTDEKKWIFELTKEGTLWYNYYFFERIFKLISLNVVENQHHITKWVEDTIQNGVKETNPQTVITTVEDIIQNGVKHTLHTIGVNVNLVEDIIQNGVKHTQWGTNQRKNPIEDTIQNGIKHTEYGDWLDGDERFDDIIRDGVKETWGYEKQPQVRVNEVINKGEKTIWNNDTTKL
jgi:hypothetical protein